MTPEEQEAQGALFGEEVVPTAGEESATEEAEQPAESQEQINWKALRAEKERLEKEAMENAKYKSWYEQQMLLQQQQARPAPPSQDPFDGMDNEEIPTVGQLRKWEEKQRQERMMLEQQREFNELCPDFSNVVNPQSIASFEKENPRLARYIGAIKDPYEQAIMTYNALHKKPSAEPETSYAKPAKSLVPTSSSAVPKRSALAEANGFIQGALDESLKEQYWKEMQQAIKHY